MRTRRRSRRFQTRSAEVLESRSLLTAFTPGNIVVSNSPFGEVPLISEYDPDGDLIQSFEIARDNSTSERPRDIAIGSDGHAWIYDGTFEPNLTELDPVTGEIDTSRSFENWSTANNIRYGGVAILDRYAFATDTKTGSDAESDVGIIRFDLDSTAAQRFGSEQGRMIDVAVGWDGKIYALGPSGSPSGTHVHVFDPETLAFERTIEMEHASAAIAVNSEGMIFGVDDDLRMFNANGEQIGDPLSGDGLSWADIDLDAAGNLLLASSNGTIGVTTEALVSLTTFQTRESNFTNFATWVPIPATLNINTQGGTIAENGEARAVILSRTGPVAEPLTVTLSSSDLTELTVPEQVVIPAGAAEVEFQITPVDDLIADGTQAVAITASASEVRGREVQIAVTDNESPQLEFEFSINRLEEGGDGATVNLFRNTPVDSALVVELTTSVAGQLIVPTSVTIPAGAESIEFQVSVVDEEFVDGDLEVEVTAAATGHASFTRAVDVIDNDELELDLNPPEASISENGGTVTVTVSRNVDSDEPLVVELNAAPSSAISIPATVTIAGGAQSAAFQVQAIDNMDAFGNTVVALTASSPEVRSASATIEVIDDDDPALEIELSQTDVFENVGTISARVFRNTPTLEPLTVQLSATPGSLVGVDSTVVIPAGQEASEPFVVTVIDDLLVNGDRTALLTASAEEFLAAEGQLLVRDDDEATLEVDFASPQISENGGQTTFVVRTNSLTNQPIEVSLSSTPSGFVDHPLTVSIAAGELESEPITISAIDNDDFFGNVTIQLTAVLADLVESAELLIEEDDLPELSIQLSTLELAEGGGNVLGSIQREGDLSEELVVSLQSDSDADLVFPTTLTIPAGQNESPSFQLSVVDDELHEGTETIELTATADGIRDGVLAVEVEDNDSPPRSPGNVDDDGDFDSSDTFLILISLLSASETQLEDFRGESTLSGSEIRDHVDSLESDGDIDGDGDFDANDGFLMLLVMLSADDDQIDFQKGASPLTAQQIRSNVEQLGNASGQTSSAESEGRVSLLAMQLPERTSIFQSQLEAGPHWTMPESESRVSEATDFWSDDRQWLEVLR